MGRTGGSLGPLDVFFSKNGKKHSGVFSGGKVLTFCTEMSTMHQLSISFRGQVAELVDAQG